MNHPFSPSMTVTNAWQNHGKSSFRIKALKLDAIGLKNRTLVSACCIDMQRHWDARHD
ncbi:hypothetical protein V1281_007300 [Nitrobacteraceae bacterium AZCC 2161]